jgi:hypothetical protein
MEHCELHMELGKPDAGKPSVRFDEGWKTDVIGLRDSQSVALPTLHLLWLDLTRERWQPYCTL